MTALASLVRRTAILVLLLLFAAGVQAAARVYPLEAVQPGLRGTAKTVVRGTEIETFEVEFLGVMRDAGPAGDLILIRASGDVIDRTGGIAAGMSGSPVYIGDQLVGAIAYAYSLSDHRIGFVTPIRDMLEVLRMLEPDREAAPAVPADEPGATDGGPAAGPLAGTGEVSVREVILAESWQEAGELAREAPPGTMVFAPVRAPLLASGFSSRAFARLGEDLRAFNLVPVQAGGQAPPEAAAAPALEPGSAFGVQLVRGDVSLTSIGTVTYVEDDRFVGFGHSFLDRGPVDYVTTSAYIHYVVPSIDFPFKIGSVLEPVGALAQDRGAGVAGRIGQTPRMIPVTVSVQDLDRGVTRTTNFEVAADESFIVSLATSGALSALDRSLDRLGRGTARVVFRIEGEGMPKPLVRDNLYYSEADIAALSLLEFMEAVSLVVRNRFSPVELTRIQLTAQVEEARWTAHIERAAPDRREVRPGETVRIEVQLRPYRSEPVREVIALTVPEDAAPGYVTVEVRGGGWGLRPPIEAEEDIVDDPEEVIGIVDDLERLIDEFVRRERNNEIVAEFYGRRSANFGETEAGDEAADDGAEEPAAVADLREEPPVGVSGWFERHAGGGWVVETRPTRYVILGSQIFDLYITGPEDAETAEDAEDGNDEADRPGEPGEKPVSSEGAGAED